MIKRVILSALALLVFLGIAAPFMKGDRYGQQIREALERGLHRKVEIGQVRFNLFTGPGFTVENVLIYEDPAFGLEPFAHMEGLEARVSLSSLFTGTLEFSTVRFLSPSVNLVKPASGTWNVVKLMQDAKTTAQSVPEIQVSDGRIYLKNGETKSAFYIAAADVTISPRRDGIGIRFEGEPARTDRSARTAGAISARGELVGGHLNLDLQVENSPVDELGGLLRGRLLEYHGSVSSRAKLSGPLSKLDLTGSFTLADVHRWDVTAEHNTSWTVKYKGVIDTSAANIYIATVDSPNKLYLQVTNWQTRPQWILDVAINELSAANMVNIARDLGAPMPASFSVAGKVMGNLRFGSDEPPLGELRVTDGAVRLQDGPELRLAEASLNIDGDSIHLEPAALTGEEGQGAQLEGVYNTVTRTVDATIRGQGLRLLSRAAVPLVTRFQGGTWSAALQYRQQGNLPAVWSGSFEVRDTVTRVPGLVEPLKIATAQIEIDGDAMKVRHLRGIAGTLDLYGSYTYLPADPRPHRFDFTIPEAGLGEVERLLAPALRRDEGFFARTLRLRRAKLPDWLQHRRAEGVLRIGVLTAGDLTARDVRSRVVWDGAVVQLANLQGRLDEGSFKGSGTVDITKSEPQYKLSGEARNLAWKNGRVDLKGEIETLGSGIELLLSLRGKGGFAARGILLSPEQVIRTATGDFSVAAARTGLRFRLADVEASLGAERFTGDGSTLADGRMQMELASANRTLRVNFDIAR